MGLKCDFCLAAAIFVDIANFDRSENQRSIPNGSSSQRSTMKIGVKVDNDDFEKHFT